MISLTFRQRLHEAARSGHIEVVRYLVEKGSKIDLRANRGRGGSPLWWAQEVSL